MAAAGPLARTPFFSFDRRPFREERLAAYIHREHRAGRRVSEILDDPCVERLGGQGVLRAVLRRRELIGALEQDVRDAIERCRPD